MTHAFHAIALPQRRNALDKLRFGARALSGALFSAVDVVMMWHERAKQRRQLAGLNDYELKDIGLSRADVEREVRKPIWSA